ncbi:MAG: TlpA disulfide reductase family protein [Gemmatimonadota bacterium]
MHARFSHVLACCVAVAAAGCVGGSGLPGTVGSDAPAYGARTLDGDSVSLADLDGPVMLNVWATWCHPCLEEMPGLQAVHATYAGSGLRVVGVSVDGARADADVREFVRQHGIAFVILRDPSDRFARTFRTNGVPETFLIDRDGRIAARWIGQFDPMSDEAQAKVRQALAAP